jgi:hypothetical protein
MNENILSAAIALSAGNKAKTTNVRGETIVVQQQFPEGHDWNLHVWVIAPDRGHVRESDFQFRQGYKLKEIYEVDPGEKIWAAV